MATVNLEAKLVCFGECIICCVDKNQRPHFTTSSRWIGVSIQV